jgi:hypothetical protein
MLTKVIFVYYLYSSYLICYELILSSHSLMHFSISK